MRAASRNGRSSGSEGLYIMLNFPMELPVPLTNDPLRRRCPSMSWVNSNEWPPSSYAFHATSAKLI
jgi:hypothetical protein